MTIASDDVPIVVGGPVVPVPTLFHWGLMLLTGLLGLLGAGHLRRQGGGN